jgi:4'-phosphopantetheinyl transferase
VSIRPAQEEVVAIVLSLDVPDPRFAQLAGLLAAREVERFRSYKDPLHGRRWAAARGQLREVLGSALGIAPAQVQFRYASHGKPFVEGISFNLSHSGELALLALARCEVGADIERHKPRRWEDIARRFYAPGEQERVFGSPDGKGEATFFRIWSCKEAFLKCTGEGLSRSLRSYEMELRPDGARLAWAKGVDAARYSVFALDPAPGYAAAVVAEAPVLSIRRAAWPTGTSESNISPSQP